MSATEQRGLTGSTGTLDVTAEGFLDCQLAEVGEIPFRAMIEGMLEGVAVLDREWRFRYLNEAGAQSLGAPREVLLGKTILDHEPDLIGSSLHGRFVRCLEGGEPQRFEAPFTDPKGVTRWFEFSVRPSSEGVLVLSLDVTARHQAADADARLRAALESIDLVAVILDLDGRVTFANDALSRATGWSREEALGERWLERFVPEDARAAEREAFDAAVRTGEAPARHERDLMTRGGQLRTIAWSHSVLRDGSGAVAAVAAVGDDVTDRRALEHAFLETNRSVSAAVNVSEDSIAIYRAVLDSEGRFADAEVVFANAATGRWLPDIDPAGALGRRLFELAPDVRPLFSDLYATVVETGRPVHAVRESKLCAETRIMDITVTPYADGFVHVARDVTDLYRTTAALREREEELRQTLGAVDAIIVWTTHDGGPITVSPQVERILGWKPEELTSFAAWNALVHPEDLGACLTQWDQSEDAWRLRYRIRRANGTYATVDDRGRRNRGAGGERGTFRVIVDVSERVAADAALAVSEERLRQIVEGVEAIVGFQASSDGPLELSPQIERILGWTPEQVTDLAAWRELVHPDDLPRCVEVWDQELPDWQLEYRVRRADGTWAWLADRGRKGSRTGGSGSYMFGIMMDATERHRADDALRASEERQRRTIESLDGIVAIQEHSDAPLICSPQMERILGVDPASVTSFDAWRNLVHPDDIPRCLVLWENRPPQWEIEYRMRRPDGRDVWVLDRGRRIPREDGLGEGTFGIIVDVTDRHVAAEALRAREEQLRRSQRLEAVGQLAGGVAHDFNNLLAAIRGYSELVLDDLPVGSPASADLEEVLRAADRAAALTRQLLLFSRRQVLAPKLVDPAAVVDGIFPMLRQLVGEDVELIASTDDEDGLVLADPGQLEQMILNLVVNARDAMPGGGRIEVATRRMKPGPSTPSEARPAWPALRIMVADTGCGIDAEALPHIFEPFFTTKEAGRGSGMGLATVYGIVAASGGTVSVSTTPGRGTTFTIDLPLVDERAGGDADRAVAAAGGHAMAIATPASAPAVRDESDTGRGRVLLVEDDPAVRTLLSRMLGRLGWRVAERSSGNAVVAALDVGELTRPDLLVTDVRMPGLQGPDLARHLRATWPHLPVLFVTGLADEVGADLDEPWVHVLTKPFNIDDLTRAIETTLGEAN